MGTRVRNVPYLIGMKGILSQSNIQVIIDNDLFTIKIT